MNTFHPYTDEDNEVGDNEYSEDIDAQNYSQNYDPRYQNQQIDPGMFPPDDSFIDIDQLNNKGRQNIEEKFNSKPKSRGRYENQQETGNFKDRRKQWQPRASNLPPVNSELEYSNSNLNLKDRQFLERKYENSQFDDNLYPDVSQINEDEFLTRDDYSNNQPVYRASNVDRSVVEQSNDYPDNNTAELIEIHNNFFSNIQKMNLDDEAAEKLINMERIFRTMIHKISSPNSGAISSGEMQELNALKNMMQQITPRPEAKIIQRPSVVKEPEVSERPREDQNIHPNIRNQDSYEEEKFNQSMLNESIVNNRMRMMNQISRNEPVTPESVSKKVAISREMPELGMRAQRYDSMHDHSPIHPINMPTEGDEVNEESNNEELSLNLQQRLAHKKWQIRK